MATVYEIRKIEVVTKESELVGNDGRIWIETVYKPEVQVCLCESLETAQKLLLSRGYHNCEDGNGVIYDDKFCRGFPNAKDEDEKFEPCFPGIGGQFVYGKSGYVDDGGRIGWIGDIMSIKEIGVIGIDDIDHAYIK